MPSKFGGVPVASGGSRFGGVRVQAQPGSPEDDARRIAQGGRTFAQQDAIAQRDADAYTAAIAKNQQGRDIGRTLALGGRSVLRGVASIPDIVVSPLTALANRFGANQMNLTESVDYLADKIGAPRPETAQERVLSDVNSAITGAGGGIGVARQLAQRTPGVISRIGQALSSRPGAQIGGAVTGSTAAGVTRESGGTPGQQLAAGIVGSLVPSVRPVAAAGVSGALANSVPQARKELAREAAEQGIQLTPAQLSDSRFLHFAQSVLRSIPFTGAQGRFQQQVGNYNRALARSIGEDADNLGPEVYSRAKTRQSAEFDELTARNDLKVDNSLVQRLQTVADDARVAGLQDQVQAAIDSLYSRATTGPGGVVIPGAAYQAFDSQMNNIIKAGGTPAHFLGELQSAVRGAMDRSISPEDAHAWAQLRREYGTRKTLAPLAAKATEGEIRPASVLGAATSTRAGKEAMATGRSPLNTLSRIGQLMKEPPSSGTSERAAVTTLLGGATVIDPITGGLTAGALNLLSRGLDSRRLAQLMIRENPGMNMQTAMEVIERSALPAAIVTQQQQEP